MDRNNDTWVDQEEFKQGMNLILTILDLDQVHDDSLVATFYNLVFPSEISNNDLSFMGMSGQKTGLMSFIKTVLKGGFSTFMSDNSLYPQTA